MQKRLLGVLALSLAPGLARGEGPTYSKDVAPILLKNCAGCHPPGEVGPRPSWNMAGDGFAMPEPARERVKAAIRAGRGRR